MNMLGCFFVTLFVGIVSGGTKLAVSDLPCAAKLSNLEMSAMLKVFLHTKRWILIPASIFSFTITGCLESTFNLASKSELHEVWQLQSGFSRDDVSVTLDFYIPWAGEIYTPEIKTGKSWQR